MGPTYVSFYAYQYVPRSGSLFLDTIRRRLEFSFNEGEIRKLLGGFGVPWRSSSEVRIPWAMKIASFSSAIC